MPFMYRFKVDLSSFGTGGAGINILHTTTGVADDPGDMGNFMNQIHNGYDSIKGHLVSGMAVNINPEVTKHDVETGLLVGVFNLAPPAPIIGAATGTSVSRAQQVVCRHNTDAVTLRGKRLIGRTFVGPVGTQSLDTNGHLNATALTQFAAMWSGMQDVAGTCRLIVWHRPLKEGDDGFEPGSPGNAGSFGHVQNTIALPLPGSLRSRRD